jgi:peptidoglycan/LPS O-acetylase OafA/YrhL
MLRTLQAGRAAAALAVVTFHLSIMMGEKRYGGVAVFSDFTKHGHYGVEFFFVLSGFIILFAHFRDINNPQAWGNYVIKRFTRIYPIYWVYTGLFVLVFLTNGGTDAKLPSSLNDWITSITLIHFTDSTAPLPQAWTLFYEIGFYAFFSILILNRRIGFIAFTLLLIVCLLSFLIPRDDAAISLSAYNWSYNLYFFFGMGAYGLYQLGGSGKIEFLLGLLITVFAFTTMPLAYELSSIFIVLGFTIFLAGSVKLELSNAIQIPVFLNFIGNASYTIYLTHSNIMGMLLKASEKINLFSKMGSSGTYIFVLTVTVILGCLTYLIIEKNILKLVRCKQFSK